MIQQVREVWHIHEKGVNGQPEERLVPSLPCSVTQKKIICFPYPSWATTDIAKAFR